MKTITEKTTIERYLNNEIEFLKYLEFMGYYANQDGTLGRLYTADICGQWERIPSGDYSQYQYHVIIGVNVTHLDYTKN